MATAILGIPALAAALIALLPASVARMAQAVALLASLAVLALACVLVMSFDPALAAPQFEQRLPWVPEMGISYHVGVDGLSVAMIVLTALLSVAGVLASIGTVPQSVKAYFAWFMLLESAILGVFFAQDWFLFYVFWEVALIPMFFLIGIWGGEKRAAASLSFFLYTLAGSMLMLVGMMAAYLATPDHSFEMVEVAKASAAWSRDFQILVFGAMFIGMAVKIPSVPLHGWLPLAHVQAPVPVSMMLSGVLLKMGAYGLFRLLEVAPLGATFFVPWLFALGMISIVYGAFMALKQDDLKAMVAFSSISHMGFVLVGVSSLNLTGFSGAMLQMFTHGIVTAALFMLVGVAYDQTHTRLLSELTGAGKSAPRYTAVMAVSLLAAMGLPGLSGFVSEFHVLVGAYAQWGLWVLLAGIGILVTSAYCLRVLGRMFIATAPSNGASITDLGVRELLVAGPLALLMVLLGLMPAPMLSLFQPALQKMVILQ